VATGVVLAGLHGEALDAAMARKFQVDREDVTVGDGAQTRTFTLVKPANADHLISDAD